MSSKVRRQTMKSNGSSQDWCAAQRRFKNCEEGSAMTNTNSTIATTRCQQCGKRFRIDANPGFLLCAPTEYEGRVKRCPACHELFTVKLDDDARTREAVIDWLNG